MPSTPLLNPREFFAERTPSLLGAAIILYFAGVFAVSTGAPYAGQTAALELSTEMLLLGIFVGGAIGAATIWAVFTGVIYLATAVVGGSGSIGRTAANVGWGLLPLLVVNAIYSVIVWTLFVSGHLPTISPATLQDPLWLRLVNVTTSVIGYLWIGYLFTYAIHEARNVSLRVAVVIAGILSVASIIFSVSSFV